MSDIGLTGLSSTALSKIGPNGETIAGGVNDTTSSLSPFGPGGKAVNEAGEAIKSVDAPDISGLFNAAQNLLGGIFGRGRKVDLKYPLETEGGAYQARVQFTMFEMKSNQDGTTQKRFNKIATDNTKGTKSVAKSADEKGQLVVDDFRETAPRLSPQAYGGAIATQAGKSNNNAAASGAEATTTDTRVSARLGRIGDSIDKKLNEVKKSEEVRFLGNTLSGQLTPHKVQGAPVVDMYFPLTMQFNDNAQYDNAPLGALGAGVESAIQGGQGALEAAISEAGKSFTSIIDVATGNDELGNTAFKLGAARAIDKVSSISSGVANALTLQNRTIINPNIRALFRGVGLREFTFQFKMIARSQRESEEVRQIVKHFREQMYPDVYSIGTADIGFKFPNMFQIDFRYNGNNNRNIPKIHKCYLRTVSTTVNPTGGAMRKDGAPNEIDLTLSFVEHKTLNQKDVRNGY
tara:strand:+ start:377 stop:1762 length:1386 start_codon:yes stop_codon:yes gene_type:complete